MEPQEPEVLEDQLPAAHRDGVPGGHPPPPQCPASSRLDRTVLGPMESGLEAQRVTEILEEQQTNKTKQNIKAIKMNDEE